MSSTLRRLAVPLANLGFVLAGAPAAWRFARAVADPREAQRRLLLEMVRSNADTAYGRAHGFAGVGDEDSFRTRVPPVGWDELGPWVQRAADGEPRVLTAEPVRLFERTSGSTSGTKLVPYTAGLLHQFQEAIGTWIFDLYRHRPSLLLGPAYWCITPLGGGERRTAGGIPVGVDDDASYMGPLRQAVLDLLLVVPRTVASAADRDAFRYLTLRHLLEAEDLALVSIWSPSFLTSLLEPLAQWQERLARDLEAGTVTPPPSTEPGRERRAPRPDRAVLLRETLEPARLWPRLRLLSAWADWTSADAIPALRGAFPGVEIQPKGLLATEGVVSFPVVGEERGAVPAITSTFLEFEDDEGRSHLVTELDEGAVYRVRVTTAGGLWRYALGDRVQVTGRWRGLPLLRFVGRERFVADWYGEKLDERHVRGVLEGLFTEGMPSFAMLALERSPRPRYVLWTEGEPPGTGAAGRLDDGLAGNHHYAGCRKLGQLHEVEVVRLSSGGGQRGLIARALAEGGREGDQKPRSLDRRADWGVWFRNGTGDTKGSERHTKGDGAPGNEKVTS